MATNNKQRVRVAPGTTAAAMCSTSGSPSRTATATVTRAELGGREGRPAGGQVQAGHAQGGRDRGSRWFAVDGSMFLVSCSQAVKAVMVARLMTSKLMSASFSWRVSAR